jgi:hypothetical protein
LGPGTSGGWGPGLPTGWWRAPGHLRRWGPAGPRRWAPDTTCRVGAGPNPKPWGRGRDGAGVVGVQRHELVHGLGGSARQGSIRPHKAVASAVRAGVVDGPWVPTLSARVRCRATGARPPHLGRLMQSLPPRAVPGNPGAIPVLQGGGRRRQVKHVLCRFPLPLPLPLLLLPLCTPRQVRQGRA